MKRLSIVLALVIMFGTVAEAATIYRITDHDISWIGDPDMEGFADVDVYWDGEDDIFVCEGNSYKKCSRSAKTPNDPLDIFYDDMFDYAYNEIQNAVLSGSHVANFIHNSISYYRSVSWTSAGENSEIIVIINIAN